MKTINFLYPLKTILNKTLILALLPSILWAQRTTHTLNDTAQSIEKMHLKQEVFAAKKPSPHAKISRQEKILAKFFLGPELQSHTGIPQVSDNTIIGSDVLSAYSPMSLINETLESAQYYKVGEKIRFYMDNIVTIVALSEKKNDSSSFDGDELFMRITLNRALDVTQSIIGIVGTSNSLTAKKIANFLEVSLTYAKDIMENPRMPLYQGIAADPYRNSCGYLSIAEYGRIYSNLLFSDLSSSSISAAAEAIILMKLVGYLGYDVSFDVQAKVNPLNETLADIYRLQNTNVNYQRVLKDLKNGKEVGTDTSIPQHLRANLQGLRSDVYRILEKLPGRLSKVGICPIGVVDGSSR